MLSVNVSKAKKTSITVFSDFSARLEGQQTVEIKPKIEGYIKGIHVDEGQKVKKGQLMFTLETNILSKDAAVRKALIKSSQLEVDKLKPLVDKGIISPLQLQTAQANLDQAKSSFESVMANVDYALITSPIDGVIGSLPYKIGALVNSASMLTMVSDTRIVRVYFSMNEKQYLQMMRLHKSNNSEELIRDTAPVSLLLPDNTLYSEKGKVQTINGLTDRVTGSIEFRANFPNPDNLLRSGGTGILKFPTERENVFLVPQVAVFEFQDKKFVYLVDQENTIHPKNIQEDGVYEDYFIVTDGLQEGDLVVSESVYSLKDGEKVSPQMNINNNPKEN